MFVFDTRAQGDYILDVHDASWLYARWGHLPSAGAMESWPLKQFERTGGESRPKLHKLLFETKGPRLRLVG